MMRQNVAESAREGRDEWQHDIEERESEGDHPKQAQAGGGATHGECSRHSQCTACKQHIGGASGNPSWAMDRSRGFHDIGV